MAVAVGESPHVWHQSPGLDEELEATFVAIRELLILQQPGYALLAVSKFYELMARVLVLQAGKMGETAVYPDTLRIPLMFLAETCTEPFSAAITADHGHVSQSHLCALFEKWMGESPTPTLTLPLTERGDSGSLSLEGNIYT